MTGIKNKLLISFYKKKIKELENKKVHYFNKYLGSYDFDISVLKKYDEKIKFYKEKIEELKFGSFGF